MTQCIVEDEPRDLVFECLFEAMAVAKVMGEPSLRRIVYRLIEARESGTLERLASVLEWNRAEVEANSDTGARAER